MNDFDDSKKYASDDMAAEYDPAGSKEELQEVLSRPISHFHKPSTGIFSREEPQTNGVIVGEIVSFEEENGVQQVFVTYPGNPYTTPLYALSTINIKKEDLGKRVVLSFDQGSASRPIIMGVVQQPQVSSGLEFDVGNDLANLPLGAKLDGQQVTLKADKEIVLKCGKSSITLTKAGKIIIRGEYLLSRSSGVNKIKGGSVQIN
jgi:hypothetical protein